MKRVSVRFSDKEHEEMSALCDRLERSQNEVIREAVREYVDRKKQESKSRLAA